ncbi:MAG: hypothetical protein ACRD2O_06805 [Terriglobia bacterium]
MRTLVSACMLALVLSSSLAVAAARGRSKSLSFQERLRSHVAALDGTKVIPIQALVHTAFEHQLPFALEYIDRDAVKVQPQLKLPAATVRQRIGSLVGLVPGFRVSFANGLVDVYSPAARADSSNLLNVVLHRFTVQHLDAGLAAHGVRDGLVAQIANEPGGFASIAGVAGPPVTIDARDIRVYEVLNRIVAEQGHSMWVVGVPPEKLSKLDGDLWHFYGLYPVFESTVVERLLGLFPKQ